MHKNLAWTQQQVDSMKPSRFTSQVVMCAPAERADELLLFLLYPCLLCGQNPLEQIRLSSFLLQDSGDEYKCRPALPGKERTVWCGKQSRARNTRAGGPLISARGKLCCIQNTISLTIYLSGFIIVSMINFQVNADRDTFLLSIL
jgi:hypothetical protein